MARSRRQQRWGRLLAVGLTLILVATVVPGARADTDDGGGMPSSWEPVGDEALNAQTFEAEALAKSFEDQTPVTLEGDGDARTDTVESLQDSQVTGSGDLPTGGEEQPRQSPPPLVVAERRLSGQPPSGQQREADTGDPLDQAGQEAQLDTSRGCGADRGCPQGPNIPEGLTVAAVRGVPGGGLPREPRRSSDQ
jgi:hypothetical protein